MKRQKILPGTTATVFNALNTRNVLNTDTFPKLTKNVIYLNIIPINISSSLSFFYTYASVITIKSNQFHGSRKNVCFCRINPRATHFVNASNV